MARLEVDVKALQFPHVADADGDAHGEGTWVNAIAIVEELVGHGITLLRANTNRVRLGVFFFCCPFFLDLDVPFSKKEE